MCENWERLAAGAAWLVKSNGVATSPQKDDPAGGLNPGFTGRVRCGRSPPGLKPWPVAGAFPDS